MISGHVRDLNKRSAFSFVRKAAVQPASSPTLSENNKVSKGKRNDKLRTEMEAQAPIQCMEGAVCLSSANAVTLDDLEVEFCVGDEHGHCVNCDTAAAAKRADPEQFGERPAYSLFGDESVTAAQLDRLWLDLERKCRLSRPETSSAASAATRALYVPLPDVKQVHEDVKLLLQRTYIGRKRHRATHAFIGALADMAALAPTMRDWTESASREGALVLAKQALLDVVERHRLACRLVHKPLTIPFAAATLLRLWAHAESKNRSRLTTFLRSRPAACIEAVLQLAIEKLTPASPLRE
jgi:hypothetical protein